MTLANSRIKLLLLGALPILIYVAIARYYAYWRPHAIVTPVDVWDIQFSPDSQQIAIVGEDCKIRFWDISTSKFSKTLHAGIERGIPSVRFSPDGRSLAVAKSGRNATVWDIATGKLIWNFPAVSSSASIQMAAFSSDGKVLTCWEGQIPWDLFPPQDWDLRTGKHLKRKISMTSNDFEQYQQLRRALSPDKKWECDRSGPNVILKDALTRTTSKVFKEHRAPVLCTAFSPDGTRIASGGLGKSVVLRRVK
jgi:WD40 repeat protein